MGGKLVADTIFPYSLKACPKCPECPEPDTCPELECPKPDTCPECPKPDTRTFPNAPPRTPTIYLNPQIKHLLDNAPSDVLEYVRAWNKTIHNEYLNGIIKEYLKKNNIPDEWIDLVDNGPGDSEQVEEEYGVELNQNYEILVPETFESLIEMERSGLTPSLVRMVDGNRLELSMDEDTIKKYELEETALKLKDVGVKKISEEINEAWAKIKIHFTDNKGGLLDEEAKKLGIVLIEDS